MGAGAQWPPRPHPTKKGRSPSLKKLPPESKGKEKVGRSRATLRAALGPLSSDPELGSGGLRPLLAQRGQRQGLGLRKDLGWGQSGGVSLPLPLPLFIPKDMVIQWGACTQSPIFSRNPLIWGAPRPLYPSGTSQEHPCPGRDGSKAELEEGKGLRRYGGPLTITQAPFGPNAILGVQEGTEHGRDPGASYEWVVRSTGMTPQERVGLGEGGAPQLSQEGPPPSQEGALGGAGLRLAQKGWDGVLWQAQSQRLE